MSGFSVEHLFTCIRERKSNPLDSFILVVIVISAVVIGLETDKAIMASYGSILRTIDVVIFWIFVVEVVIKLMAFERRPWRYFADGWNVFDFSIVFLGFLPLIFEWLNMPQEGDYHAIVAARLLRLARAARVLRVLRFVTHLRPLQILIETLLRSVPSLMYVALMMTIIFYIYAVVGVFLFGENDPLHFGNIGEACLTLFQCLTGEDWHEFMNIQRFGALSHELYEGKEALVSDNQAFPYWAPAYFVSFMAVGGFIVLNLVIGVIVNAIEQVRLDEDEENLAAAEAGKTLSSVQKVSSLQAQVEHLQVALQQLEQDLIEEQRKK